MNAIFFYDWSREALVFPGPDGKPMAVTTADLQAASWHCTSAEFRQALPRIDKSRLA